MLQPIRSASSLQTSSSLRHPSGRRQRATTAQHAALEVGQGALLLGPLQHRQHDVGDGRRLRQHEVRHDEQVERSQPLGDDARVGGRDDGVGAVHEQHPRPALGAERGEQLEGAAAGTGQVGRVDAPHRRDVRPRCRVVDLAVAGQLVGLLAVLAATLPVALAGDRAEAGARVAGETEGERERDEGRDGVGAARVLLGAAGRQDVGAALGVAGPGQRRDRRAHRRDGDAGDPLRPLGQPLGGDRPEVVEARGALRDEGSVRIPLGHGEVEHAERERCVGARAELQVHATAVERLGGGRGEPRVGDHEPAGVGRAHEVGEEGRHRLGGVGAEQEHGVRRPDVGDREGEPPVEAEAADAGRRGRAHAPAAVVVDLARAQRHSRELAQLVGLLVRQSTTAEDRHRVASVCRLRPDDAVGHDVERIVPRRGHELAVAAHEGSREASRCAEQLGARPALLAQPSPVGREAARRDGEVGRRRAREGHRALQAAVGAVGRDAGRRVVRGRGPAGRRPPWVVAVVVIGGSAPW